MSYLDEVDAYGERWAAVYDDEYQHMDPSKLCESGPIFRNLDLLDQRAL